MKFSATTALKLIFCSFEICRYLAEPVAGDCAVQPTLLGTYELSSPAFLSFVERETNGAESASKRTDLMITEFGEYIDGKVVEFINITTAMTTPGGIDSLDNSLLGEGFSWPNMAELVPRDVFSQDERAVICGAAGGQPDCDAIIVPDGFLTPGHKTGGIYLQPIQSSSSDGLRKEKKVAAASNAMPFFSLAKQETNWFYHMAHWIDLDGDGLQDILAARCNIDALGRSKGELIWLRHPDQTSYLTQPWEMFHLADGPDVVTLIMEEQKEDSQPSSQKVIRVFSAQFFSELLTLTTITTGTLEDQERTNEEKNGSNEFPRVDSFIVLDDTVGPAYVLNLADVDGDGENELVVSTHEGGDGGYVYSYELPEDGDYASSKLVRVTLTEKGDFTVTKFGLNQASPGFMYPLPSSYDTLRYLPVQNGTAAAKSLDGRGSEFKRPSWIIAGDGSESVHLMVPLDVESGYSYETCKLLDIGGTVGSLAAADLDLDGKIELVVPDYDHNIIYFYRL